MANSLTDGCIRGKQSAEQLQHLRWFNAHQFSNPKHQRGEVFLRFYHRKEQDHKIGAVQPGEVKVALRPHHNLPVFEECAIVSREMKLLLPLSKVTKIYGGVL